MDLTTEADIRRLVDAFYARVQQDPLLGPVFNDVARVAWSTHLPAMYDFWSSILLGTSRYKGRPFPKHVPLPIGAAHFQRWLQLFELSVEEQLRGPTATEAKARARSIARLFAHRLGVGPALDIL